ncbi:hypothetical protein ACC676_01035 [Rhizobium ruizarguesonis]
MHPESKNRSSNAVWLFVSSRLSVLGATISLSVLAGCQAIAVDKPDALNEYVSYLPWNGNTMQLLPGMQLRSYSTSLAPKGKNERVPLGSDEAWTLPAPGEVTHNDWARFQHLLSASVPQDRERVTISAALKDIAKQVPHDASFSDKFGERVVGEAVRSMELVYTKYELPAASSRVEYVKNVICKGNYSDLVAGAAESLFVRYRVPSMGDFHAYAGDDWYHLKDINQLGRQSPNEWYKPAPVDPIDVRQSPDAAIRVQIGQAGAREWASPCLSLHDVELRTGSPVVAVRRSTDFLNLSDEKLRKKLTGRDGRYAIVFQNAYRLSGASAYYKAPADLKNSLVLAHGDVIILASPPERSIYRLD